jgi:hypothetical protein
VTTRKAGGTAVRKPSRPAKKAISPASTKWEVSGKPGVALDDALAQPLVALEAALGMPVWLLVQNATRASLDYQVLTTFLEDRDLLKKGEPIAVVIDSPGGYADMAYRIARIFCRHAGGFTAVIPRYAKSAATLLTLGADKVIMAHDAEIGPLDVQIYDEEREQRGSALDEIQALEQLHQVALQQLNQNLTLMRFITRRRYDTVLPHASKLVSDMMAPLLDKIDTVHYAKQSRLLAVAEEYALRLMSTRLGKSEARKVAEKLVKGYPEHGFVIDRREAKTMITLEEHSDDTDALLRKIENYLWDNELTLYGKLKEMT